MAEIDCDKQEDKPICDRFGVRGYPTLKVFTEGLPDEYDGTREADGIVSYMKKLTGPAVADVEGGDKLQSFIDSDRVVVMGFGEKSGADYEAFAKVAQMFRKKIVFGWATDAGAVAKYKKGVTLFKKFDNGSAQFTGSMTEADLKKFVETESIPLMDDIGPNNYQGYMDSGLPLVYLFTASPEDKKTFGSIVEPFAGKYKGKINFVHIDAMKFGGHAPYLNMEQKWPALAIHDMSGDKDHKYPFPQDQTIEKAAVEKYFADFADGKLKPKFKSQPIPETNDGPVKVVVHDEYEKIVMDKSKDVLLELYAPWCGHCKNLAPIYEELGKLFQDHKDIVIAKFDGDSNNLPENAGYTIQGFPTLKFFKAGDKKVIDFNGERTLPALVQFIKDNASVPVTVTVPVAEEKPKAEEVEEDHVEL